MHPLVLQTQYLHYLQLDVLLQHIQMRTQEGTCVPVSFRRHTVSVFHVPSHVLVCTHFNSTPRCHINKPALPVQLGFVRGPQFHCIWPLRQTLCKSSVQNGITGTEHLQVRNRHKHGRRLATTTVRIWNQLPS